MSAADDAQEELFQRELLGGGCGDIAVARSGGSLGFDSGAQFFERTLRDQAVPDE